MLEAVESRQLFAAGFASGSSVPVPFAGFEGLAGVQPLQVLNAPDGSIYTVSFGSREASNIGGQVRRVAADGTIDRTFAKGRGWINFQTESNNTAFPRRAALDGQGRLYVLSNVNQVTRYTADGRVDTSYTGDGTTTLSGFVGVSDLLIDRQDRLWVTGSRAEVAKSADGTQSRNVTAFTVGRVNSDGVYDKSFATGGIFAEALPAGPNIERQSVGRGLRLLGDGSVIATADGGYDTTVPDTDPTTSSFAYAEAVKFGPNGRLDTRYGRRGRAYYTIGLSSTYTGAVYAGVARSDGSVVMRVQTPVPADQGVGTFEVLAQITADGHASTVVPTGQTQSDALTVVRSTGYIVNALPYGTNNGIVLSSYKKQNVPTATFSSHTYRSEVGSLRFDVVYRGDVRPDTVSGDEILVANAAGQIRVARLSGYVEEKGGGVRATYRVANPDGDNGFDRDDNGTYTVIARAGGVTDKGNNDLPAQTLGTLRVRIA